MPDTSNQELDELLSWLDVEKPFDPLTPEERFIKERITDGTHGRFCTLYMWFRQHIEFYRYCQTGNIHLIAYKTYCRVSMEFYLDAYYALHYKKRASDTEGCDRDKLCSLMLELPEIKKIIEGKKVVDGNRANHYNSNHPQSRG